MATDEKINEKALAITFLIIILLGAVSLAFKLTTDYSKNDWWTKVFCLQEDGEYIERLYFDDCIINGTEYRAKFVKSGKYYNMTKLGERSEWQLVRKR